MVHYKKDGIVVFDATTEKIFRYMSAGGHPHRAFESHKLVGVSGNVVTIDAEVYNPDGSSFKTSIIHKLNPPKGVETTMKGGVFDGARFTHTYTPMSDKTKVDLAGDFPAFPGMSEADELKMIDGFFTAVFAEDKVTIPKWSAAETYAQPDLLVDTSWVLEHYRDGNVRIAEVDYDPVPNYNTSHIPGALLFDWKKDINDPVARDVLSKNQLVELFNRSGIKDGTWLVLYGDFNNWFAAFAFWVFKYYGVQNVKILNGGRKKWLLEDKPTTKEVPSYPRASFSSLKPDESLRVYKDYVLKGLGESARVLVDVRSPKEFSGEVLAPPEYPTEHAQRGGHIPEARNIPWAQAINDADGTFKAREDLEALYTQKGVTPDKEVITYCRIGERSSHSWFVLKYLLGYPNVKNYDGSWTEWGNSIRIPIER
jgi:thiosulfate/3-mercaptopyruvate sulfurtransferase